MPLAHKTAKSKTTPSTEDQENLIPKGFKLELPAGKINDIFVELKKLNVVTYRHSVSVLFRVFFEFTLDEFIKKRGIVLPKDGKGHVTEKIRARFPTLMGWRMNKISPPTYDRSIRDTTSRKFSL